MKSNDNILGPIYSPEPSPLCASALDPTVRGLKSLRPQTRQGQSQALADSRRRSCFLLTSGFTPELQGEGRVSDPSSQPLKFWALSQQQPGLQTGATPGGQQRNKAVRLSSLPSASPPPLGGGPPIPPPHPKLVLSQ